MGSETAILYLGTVIFCAGSVNGECVEGSTRLMKNGSYPWTEGEGFVEICMMGEWRSVCDDGWDMSAAMVVCREHGMLTEGRV